MRGDIRCDIFCAVIDNYGDAGVCWRLACQLASTHAWQVRLWIDQPAVLEQLAPAQPQHPVTRLHWQADSAPGEPADVVIEAFACQLPAAYVAAMAQRPQKPVWLNLEYLSAEDWVGACHGLPSPHPQLPLVKHFFFPGFTPGTGGLLREGDYAVPPAPTFDGPLDISLFCYANPALPGLLSTWAAGAQPIHCQVTAGFPQQQVAGWLGEPFSAGDCVQRNALQLQALPFLPQTAYDALLQHCQLNFVRGEDSLVRALWAQRPLVWQAYPQSEDSHLPKLAALLERHDQELDAASRRAQRDFWQAWNTDGDCAAAWPAFADALPALARQAPDWAQRSAATGDLVTNLVKFCQARL
jgi:hypothetical protein